MSHQTKLSSVVFTDIGILRQAIQEEGLSISETMTGYYENWDQGKNYTSGQTLEFGIKVGGHYRRNSPCGIVRNNSNNTYELVGDDYGISYDGVSGLKQLASNLSQRYRILDVKKKAALNGWEVVSIPSRLLRYNSKESIDLTLRKKSTSFVGVMS